MKRRFFVLIIFVLMTAQTPALADNPPETIFVLIENGATVQDSQSVTQTTKHLLGQLTQLKRRRATRDARIVIVLSARPNRVAWSGTPGQLLHQAQDVLDLITFRKSPSDLVLAFDQIRTTQALSQSGTFRLYWIGPAIHVPYDRESGKTIRIEVPQPVPEEIALAEVAKQCDTVRIFNIHPDQDSVYLDYFKKTGLMKLVKNKTLAFSIMDTGQTEGHHKDLL